MPCELKKDANFAESCSYVLPELIQIYKIPKLMQMLQLEGQDSKYSDTYQQVKDFANFLAHKSLNSELYLSVNMLYQTQVY